MTLIQIVEQLYDARYIKDNKKALRILNNIDFLFPRIEELYLTILKDKDKSQVAIKELGNRISYALGFAGAKDINPYLLLFEYAWDQGWENHNEQSFEYYWMNSAFKQLSKANYTVDEFRDAWKITMQTQYEPGASRIDNTKDFIEFLGKRDQVVEFLGISGSEFVNRVRRAVKNGKYKQYQEKILSDLHTYVPTEKDILVTELESDGFNQEQISLLFDGIPSDNQQREFIDVRVELYNKLHQYTGATFKDASRFFRHTSNIRQFIDEAIPALEYYDRRMNLSTVLQKLYEETKYCIIVDTIERQLRSYKALVGIDQDIAYEMYIRFGSHGIIAKSGWDASGTPHSGTVKSIKSIVHNPNLRDEFLTYLRTLNVKEAGLNTSINEPLKVILEFDKLGYIVTSESIAKLFSNFTKYEKYNVQTLAEKYLYLEGTNTEFYL